MSKTYIATTAEHNIKTYTSLEQMGLSDADMSATDFTANIAKINDIFIGKAFTAFLLANDFVPNLESSVIKKLNDDLSLSITAGNNFTILAERGNDRYSAVKIVVIDEQLNTIGRSFMCIYNKQLTEPVNNISKFVYMTHHSGFLPLDGSVAMTGVLLGLNNGFSYLTANNQQLQFETRNVANSDNNRRLLNLRTSANSLGDIKNALSISDITNGASTFYNIFGEHNPQLLDTTIQNLIQGGSISMIKSVQRGIITIAASATEGTATLAQAVNMSKAVVLFGGSICGHDGSASSSDWDARLVLSANNKVSAARAYSTSYTAIVPYQVLEFA